MDRCIDIPTYANTLTQCNMYIHGNCVYNIYIYMGLVNYTDRSMYAASTCK